MLHTKRSGRGMGTTREDIMNESFCEKHWPGTVNVGVVWGEAVWGKRWNSSIHCQAWK